MPPFVKNTSSRENLAPCPSRTLNVLFVRHCEATHNVADEIARAEARFSGACQKTARLAVLNSVHHLDAPLSVGGRVAATESALRIKAFVKDLGAPHVLVSPLKRATQTAAGVFSESVWGKLRICPHDLVRERITGRPCDFLQEEYELHQSKRKEFQEENNSRLGLRCAAFLKVLLESNYDQELIAVVTHKAFLRELDNYLRKHWHVCGTDIQKARIFGNAEARVYSFSFGSQRVTVRTCRPDTPEASRVAE